MQKKTIVMLGSSCMDEYYETSYIPKSGEKTLTRFVDRKVGGMIGNAAAVAASYGLSVYLMDTMTTGENTEFILEDCKRAGIHLDMIRYDETLSDVKCMLFLENGERTIFVVPTQKSDIIPDERQKEILQKADFVYTNLEELKYLKEPFAFLDWLRSVNTQVVLDVEYVDDKDRSTEWKMIQKCSLLFVNQEGDQQLRTKIGEDYRCILGNQGCMCVATKGKHGCEIVTPAGETYQIPAYPVKPVDTTGAGDTFNASFLYGMTQGWEITEAGNFANGAAARAILHMGARSGAVGESAVRSFMREWN